ncbi:unnamed protein product [Ilex paraguariensis]|uniref:Uncharacterized protein n=1 Tax=Ilex paraguariensis TaxID=185542 RepID=A0ABC8U9A8_9AQUA
MSLFNYGFQSGNCVLCNTASTYILAILGCGHITGSHLMCERVDKGGRICEAIDNGYCIVIQTVEKAGWFSSWCLNSSFIIFSKLKNRCSSILNLTDIKDQNSRVVITEARATVYRCMELLCDLLQDKVLAIDME